MLKKNVVFFLLFAVMASLLSTNATAQFWKKKKNKHQQADSTSAYKPTTDTLASRTDHKSKKELKREKKKKQKEEKKKKQEDGKKKKHEEHVKKKELKKQKKHKGKVVSNITPTTPAIINKWADIEYPLTQKKKVYRIDVLAPIYLDELVKGGNVTFKENIPEKAVAGLNFYIGVQIAADSLKKAHFDMDIYVHDIASAAESTEKLVAKGILDTADLIIGAVTSKDISMLATFAKNKKVNFISVTSPVDGGVRDDQFFTMLQPTLKSHCEWITNEVKDKYHEKKPVLLYRTTTSGDDNAFKYLSEKGANDNVVKIWCNTLPQGFNLSPHFDSTKENVVIVAILDNGYADTILNKLGREFPRYHFVIYGMPSWNSTNTVLKTRKYPNLVINVTTPFKTDPDAFATTYVDGIYKNEYGGKPNEMVYKGYETMFWYANLLKRYGTIFNRHYDDNETAPFTKFEVRPQWDNAGNVLFLENKHITVRKYDNKSVDSN